MNVGIKFTSSNVFAKNALKNHASENKLEVKNINKKAKNGCARLIFVKNSEIIKTITEIKNHLTIHQLKYPIIIECLLIGEVIISSIFLWNFAPKNELATLE